MGWNSEELEWIAKATAVAAVLLVGSARLAAVIRLRRHRNLVAEALDRMCALVAGQPGTGQRLRRLGHDVVEVLARQDSAALALRAENTPAADSAQDLALLISADAVTTAVEPLQADEPDDSVWEEADVAPSVGEHPRLQDIAEQVARSSTRLITMGRLVLAEAERFGLPEDNPKECLVVALDEARLAVRDAERLAEGGEPLAALAALTALDIPVPEAGFPGQAVADELRTQVNSLARLGLRHRTALADYREAAEAESQEERR